LTISPAARSNKRIEGLNQGIITASCEWKDKKTIKPPTTEDKKPI